MKIKILYNDPKINLYTDAATYEEFLSKTKCSDTIIRILHEDTAIETVLRGDLYLRLVREDQLCNRNLLYYILHYLTSKLWYAKEAFTPVVADVEFAHVCNIEYDDNSGTATAYVDGGKVTAWRPFTVDTSYIDYAFTKLPEDFLEALVALKNKAADCDITKKAPPSGDLQITHFTPKGNKYEFTEHEAEVITGQDDIYKAAKIAEQAGRCSHRSTCDPTEAPWKFLSKLVAMGHVSVLRHINITCRFGTDRTASHQIVRHSHISWTQESQRYVKYDGAKNPFLFVLPYTEPEDVKLDGSCKVGMRAVIENSVDNYMLLTDNGVRAEEARKVLPGCMHTILYGTGNAEAWGHFFKMRCDKHAQADIRHMALSLLERFNTLMPGLYGDLSKF